jgi:seryl-tRNA synthetase
MSEITERLTKGEENDYHPVNQYIDEQSKLRRARSFWIRAKSWALLIIAIGFLFVLLAWAYSLLHKHYILKRVGAVQERVIEERINEAISSGGISKSVSEIRMLGDNQLAIEELRKTKKALENEQNKNKELAQEIDNTSEQISKAAEELEKSVGKVDSFESEKLALLKKQQELENQVAQLKEEGQERAETIKKLEEIKEKNKNAVQNYYLFNEEIVKVSNKNLRIMTRYQFKDLNATRPMFVDCYVDFVKRANLDLVDLNLGTIETDFKVSKKYTDSGFTKQQFVDLKQNNCRYLN